MSRRREVTVREGIGKKYWMTIAGYLAVATLGIPYVFWTLITEAGSTNIVGSAMVLFVLAGLSLVVYPALFMDSSYLRESRSRWRPKWWYYLVAGLAPPVVAYAVGSVLMNSIGVSVMVAMLTFLGSSVGMSGHYLLRRHRRVGVP